MLNGNIGAGQESPEPTSLGKQSASASPLSAPVGKPPHLESQADDAVVVIGRGAKIAGEIVDSTVVDIQGEFEGEVASISVIIREGASFVGHMSTRQVQVHGSFEGSLIAEELLDIQPTGRVDAEVKYGELSVAFGACLSGSVRSKDAASPRDAAQERVSASSSKHKDDRRVRVN